MFKWAPSMSPSPLKACHQTAYPEYASIYRRMKLAAISASKSSAPAASDRLFLRRMSSHTIDSSRDWNETYEGLPNTSISDVKVCPGGKSAIVTFHNKASGTFQREVSGLSYMVGRRGSLAYLDRNLQHEVCPEIKAIDQISGSNMREKAIEDLEVAQGVFIIGSLTGDTLIRFAYGGCAHAAGKIMSRQNHLQKGKPEADANQYDDVCSVSEKMDRCTVSGGACAGCGRNVGDRTVPRYIKPMYGLDGHSTSNHLEQ